jgi:hypothetical protein
MSIDLASLLGVYTEGMIQIAGREIYDIKIRERDCCLLAQLRDIAKVLSYGIVG